MRNRQRKTDRGSASKETMMDAAIEVIDNGASLRQSAKSHNVHYSTLCRYIQKVKSAREANSAMPNPGYKSTRKVFSSEQEKLIADYLVMAGDMYYGLSPKEARQLAYQCATKFKVNFPPNWSVQSAAGEDWLSGFISRNNVLSIRRPEATSLARATSFNTTTINSFFDKLSAVIDRYAFQANDIYNLDETGVTTVQRPSKVIARKGAKQIGALTSGERGQLVTVELAVNACGNTVPPMFVFPRVNFREHFIRDGPTGCIGVAHPSGWMTDMNFVIFMRHFIKHVKPSLDHPVLLLMDNHNSHISIDAIDLCKQNGVVVLTFPPHCSHKLQPLDRSVYGPFKKYFNSACDTWMKTHPGSNMTIYDLPRIVSEALPNAITPSNIQAGFRVSGVWPFNRHIFGEHEFLPAQVTDRPEPSTPTNQVIAVPETATTSDIPSVEFSPEIVRPIPKAGPRKLTRNIRKRHSEVLTDTPNKRELEKEHAAKAARASIKKKPRQNKTNPKQISVKQKKVMMKSQTTAEQTVRNQSSEQINSKNKRKASQKKPFCKRRILDQTDSEASESDRNDDDDVSRFCAELQAGSSDSADDVDETLSVEEDGDCAVRHDRLKQGDYVLVKLQGLKQTAHFVARISDNSPSEDLEMEVTYLSRKPTRITLEDEDTVRFIIPENSKTYPVPMEDIIKKLPRPQITGGTKRVSRQITFPTFSFSGYNLKA